MEVRSGEDVAPQLLALTSECQDNLDGAKRCAMLMQILVGNAAYCLDTKNYIYVSATLGCHSASNSLGAVYCLVTANTGEKYLLSTEDNIHV